MGSEIAEYDHHEILRDANLSRDQVQQRMSLKVSVALALLDLLIDMATAWRKLTAVLKQQRCWKAACRVS